MTGAEIKAIRAMYGETQTEFGRRLGFTGKSTAVKRRMIRYEGEEVPIVGPILTLLTLLRELQTTRPKR